MFIWKRTVAGPLGIDYTEYRFPTLRWCLECAYGALIHRPRMFVSLAIGRLLLSLGFLRRKGKWERVS